MSGEPAEDAARARLLLLLGGKWLAAAVSAAATLGLPAALAAGPRTGSELARVLDCDDAALERLLRALVGAGVLALDASGRHALTDMGRALDDSDLGPLARFVGSELGWSPWASLADSVRTGGSAFEMRFGASLFDHLDADGEAAALYHEAIDAFAAEEVAGVAEGFDFSSARRIVDVGGGRGALVEGVLRRWPQLEAVLLERPAVALAAGKRLAEAGLSDRVEVRTGDFAESVPDGGDVYLLKHVVHCLADDEAIRLLARCRQALAPGGRVLVIEGFRLPAGRLDQTTLLDLEMLALCGPGHERSKPEMRRLLAAAGLQLVRAPSLAGGRA